MRVAEAGINELQKAVDTLIIIPNQNLFRIANEKTTFADAFAMADQVLYSGVACITDLMVKEGLINLDFADVRAIMREMGKAMMGTGEASGDRRAILAAEAAIANPLLDEVSMKGARGLLISITGGNDLTLYEVDEAASRIRQEVDEDANIILGATFDSSLDGIVRVSVVATGIDHPVGVHESNAAETRIAEVANRLRAQTAARPIETAPQPAFEAAAAESYAPARPAYEERAAQPAPSSSSGRRRPPQGVYVEEAAPQHPRYAEAAPQPGARHRSFRTGSVHSRRRRFAARAAAENAADRRSAAAGAKPDPRPSRRGRGAAAWRSQAPFSARAPSLLRRRTARGERAAGAARAAAGAAARGPAKAAGARSRARRICQASAGARAAGAGPAPPGRLSAAHERGGPARNPGVPAPPVELSGEGAPSLALFRGEGHARRIAGGLRGVAGAPQAGKDQLEAGRSATLMPL